MYDRTVYPKAAEYILFSSAHRTLSRIDHILGHKRRLNECKRIEIIQTTFSISTELNYKSITEGNVGNSQIHGN